MSFIIESVHAFLVVGEDGEEGIPAINGPGGIALPLIAADETRLRQFESIVRTMLRTGELPNCRLVRFSTREVLEIYKEP
jgi:hypothetical protein